MQGHCFTRLRWILWLTRSGVDIFCITTLVFNDKTIKIMVRHLLESVPNKQKYSSAHVTWTESYTLDFSVHLYNLASSNKTVHRVIQFNVISILFQMQLIFFMLPARTQTPFIREQLLRQSNLHTVWLNIWNKKLWRCEDRLDV